MFSGITNFFASPDDKDPAFIRLVRNILIFTLVATLLLTVVVITSSSMRSSLAPLAVLVALDVLGIVAFLFVRQDKVGMAKLLIPAALIFAVTINALNGNSIHDISIVVYPIIIIIGVLLQDRLALVVTVPLVVIAVTALGVLDILGFTTSPLRGSTGIDDILVVNLLLLTATGILNLLVSRLRLAVSNAKANEQAQIQANEELKALQASLEQRVQERTFELSQRGLELASANRQIQHRAAQFEALAQVARTIASVRDLQQLLPRIATVISENFDFYHVGVFLLDEAREYAVLSATNSEGGRKMLDRKHRLRVGQEGIVGYVTANGQPRIVMDVGKDAIFFDNPELPDTHSEMALPLKTENRVIGALDVQSMERGAFTDEDVQTLSLLADQVSLAIENARLFDETRTALTEAEAISRQFTREAWGRVPVEHKLLGYRYTIAGAAPLQEPVELSEPGKRKSREHQSETNQVVIPIELRGETIGSLVVQSPSSNKLNQEQIDLIKSVAERVALSAENARLFEETTRRAERERLVSDITSKIRSVNDPQTMIQTAMEELRKALGASRVEVIPQAVKGAE
jgi:GAF domain-containing protein